ncbi:histidinol-phosphate aminotransferase [Tenacibaculum sp. MAR_2009_124]|uniref:histidinol-phosphate transaminase n=1 Tax=Tenacibaculum sp. MAR_2009_124 TaxID=1250059 RepID=UPI0008961354|nr:histidinol-phosphate transaminase [Tenacibaculum sp. MAR_2009_124]SEB39828.1 histidinol-phosphate aminotransferase [Tenacibaculum sp. MAR_2009_124]
MFKLNSLIRPNIIRLKAYSSARDEFKGEAEVFLDANENPFGDLNRYPDPNQLEIKKKLSKIKKINKDQIFIGNGSDEVIDLVYRIFCEPGIDKALTFSPTYGMYDVSAAINNIELIKVPLNNNFEIDTKELDRYIKDENLKVIFICSPNNPTGNSFDRTSVEYILNNFNGIVVVDEAYIDFSSRESCISQLNDFPNLIVCQTFSKAWGLAGVRVGAAYSTPEIIDWFKKVKPPYNVSSLNQEAVLSRLENKAQFEIEKNIILNEKEKIIKRFQELKLVKKIYPSEANFILIEVINANDLYENLVNQRIITRNRSKLVRNGLRITVGSKQENDRLIQAMERISKQSLTPKT